MEETREERQKRNEQNANSLLIRNGLKNIHNIPKLLPMLSPETRDKIQKAVDEFLPKIRELFPVIKDEIKGTVATQSEKMGIGDGKIAYVMRNGEEGLEIWTLRNPKFGGEKVAVFSFKKITDRIEKYQEVEVFIGDLLSGKLFSEKDYIIDVIETKEENPVEQNLLEQPKS